MTAFKELHFQHAQLGPICLITIKLEVGDNIQRPRVDSLESNQISKLDGEIAQPTFITEFDETLSQTCNMIDPVSLVALSLVI